jgi:hypothetical protein
MIRTPSRTRPPPSTTNNSELGQVEIVTTSNEKPVPRWYQELVAKAAGTGAGDATDRHAKVKGEDRVGKAVCGRWLWAAEE